MATVYIPFASNEWDVRVAQGMDMSVVSFLHAVVLSI